MIPIDSSAVGLFLLLAGFIIGLGAVTVIDLHGFLGRTSSYWTEATIRTHKVTKPLIWLGMMLTVIGGSLFYTLSDLNTLPVQLQIIAAVILPLNGIFLTFWISPRLIERERQGKASEILPTSWQRMIVVSLLISDLCWWGSLVCLVLHLTHT